LPTEEMQVSKLKNESMQIEERIHAN